jgi:rhodanese-related sulfurtransferase
MSLGDIPITIVDVHTKREYENFHIESAINIPMPDLRERHVELDKEMPILLICGSGHRSSLAASILKQHRFTKIYNVAGGMTGYANAECTQI